MRKQYKSMDYIKNAYEEGLSILHGKGDSGLLSLLNQLERVLEMLNKNDDFDHQVGNAYESLLAFQEEVKDLNGRFRSSPEVDLDLEMSSDEIESRLYALAQLKRKLNRSLSQIVQLKDEIDTNLSFLDACSLDIIRLEKAEKDATLTLFATVDKLNKAREYAATHFCTALQEELKGLGFSEKVSVIPEFVPHILNKGAEDNICVENTVRLLWAPNPGQAPQALDKIASGGELSRFLLAVIGLQESQSEDATLIFDEVDAGVGGITLNRVAERLTSLAEKRQMLLITHWPQLAARGKNHFRISKEFTENETFSRCIRLDEEMRKEELSRMAGNE